MTTQYGEPVPAPASPLSQELAAQLPGGSPLTPPAVTPAPADPAPAAPSVPAEVPPVGALARYTRWDSYAVPARERALLVLVTGHDTAADGTVTVAGHVLGYEDEQAAFQPGELTRLQ